MRRWMAAVAFGLMGTLAASLHAQAQVDAFVQPQNLFVSAAGNGVLRGPGNHPTLGPIAANQIAVDDTGDGFLDSIYDLPADIRNDPNAPPAPNRWAFQHGLSPTQEVLYSRRFPTAGSPSVCGNDSANSEVFFHRLDTPPAMTLLGTACLRFPFSSGPHFYDGAMATLRTAVIVAAPQAQATAQPVAWFDLVGGGQGVDGSTYERDVLSGSANRVLVSPLGNAFFVRHGTLQSTPRYSIVDLCDSRTGGTVTSRNQPANPQSITVQHHSQNGELSAVVSFGGLPAETPFPLNNCFVGPPPPPLRPLTVAVTGSGHVTSNPPGIALCGAGGPCEASYPDQTTVTLAATPLSGATFDGWSGDCSGSQLTTQVQMTAARACSATFLAPQLSISKVADLPAVAPGQTLTYTVSYANTGSAGATGVVVAETLPAGSDFVDAPGGVRSGASVTWNVGALSAGASGQVTLQVTPSCSIAQLANTTYSVDSVETPRQPGVPVTTTVGGASTAPVALEMTSVPARLPLRSGDLITHTLTLINGGSTRHPYLRVRLRLGSATAFGAIVDAGTGTLTPVNSLELDWVGALDGGATTTVVFTTIVVDCFTSDETWFNNGQVLQVENYCGQILGSVSPPAPFALQRPVQAQLTMVSPARNLVRPGEAIDFQVTLSNNLTTDQPTVAVALPLPSGLIVGTTPLVPPTDSGAVWDAATRTVSWSGTVAANGTVTITMRAVIADPAPCRILLALAGTTSGCSNLSAPLRLFVVPESPSGPHLIAVDLSDGLFLWEPGVDRNFRELLCPLATEGYRGLGRTSGGDVWVAGRPTLRAHVDHLELQEVDPGLFGAPSGPADLAYDSTNDTLISVGAGVGFARYDPQTGQVTPAVGSTFFEYVVVEPDGTVVGANSTSVQRIDLANPGSPQVFADPSYNRIFALARDVDGDYLVIAQRVSGGQDLVEIDRGTGTFTPIVSNLRIATGNTSLNFQPLAVGPGGDVYVGGRDGTDLYHIDRSGSGPAITALSTIGSVTNPRTPGVTPNSIQDLLFVGPAVPPATADLALMKTAATPDVAAGTNLTYQVSVTNNGPASATVVQMVDVLPVGVSLVSAAPSQGTCAQPGDVVCDLGVLPAGGQATVAVVVQVGSSVPAGTVLTNTASVATASPDPIAANDTASVSTPVVSAADLAILKTTPSNSVDVGAPLRYDLVVVNGGPSDAAGGVVTDPLPAGVTYNAAASSPSCAEAAGAVTCPIGALLPGGSVALAIVVVPAQAGTLVNTASVAGAGADPQPGNNSSSATVQVTEPGQGENIDPSGSGEQYAYGENVGWLNLEPLGDGGPGVEVTASNLSGWMWGENVGWCSLSCATTGSCAAAAYGVTNDGQGLLAGWAWCENAGWLSFACENTGSCGSTSYGVAIAPDTGLFSGEAWGENVGWITFGSPGPVPYGIVTSWRGVSAASQPR